MTKASKQAKSISYVPLRVNINMETSDALTELMFTRKGRINATEVVRRAISLMKFIMDEHNRGNKIMITNSRGQVMAELEIYSS